MVRSLIILLLLCAGSLAAHPFDDRADMIADVTLLVQKDKREAMRLSVQYRYESIVASYNEIWIETDKNRDRRITREELDLRFAELAKDLMDSVHLSVRGELVTLVPDYNNFEFANLDDPDATVDQPGGMPVQDVRIGYFFVFDVQLPRAWGPGEHPVQFFMANQRIMVTNPADQLRAWDDRGEMRRAITTTRYDRTPERFDRLRFLWDVKAESTTGPELDPPGIVPPEATEKPVKPDAPDLRGKEQLLETDAERHDPESTESRILHEMRRLRDGSADPLVWLIVLSIMFVWGAQHALMPGHGKTLVAAYLIGTQGKSSDALFLGVVVTAAHTSGVFLLLGASWAAAEIWPGVLQNPEKDIANWITLAVGLTILILGVGLVLKRTGGGHHEHDVFGRHVHPEHDHDHSHDHSHAHDHHHDHDHVHGHDHDHGHHHHHHGRDPGRMTRGEILRLGILGGLVPCPSAFVIGLIAFQWQQYAWGLILVTVFSLGLALVLASIGLMLVRSKEYLNRKPEKHKSPLRRNLEAKLPVFGALVIALLGTAMTLLALLRLDLIDPTTFAV